MGFEVNRNISLMNIKRTRTDKYKVGPIEMPIKNYIFIRILKLMTCFLETLNMPFFSAEGT